MGKKKSSQHADKSFGNMVSKAALTQMAPEIQQMVDGLGSRLAAQIASTLENQHARLVVLEKLAMERFNLTKDDLSNKISDFEDEKEGLVTASQVELGDVVRLEIKTRTEDQAEFQGSSRLKVYNTGSGDTLGGELEAAVLGMTPGQAKETKFGQDGKLVAQIRVDRISRLVKASDANPVQG